MFRMLLLSLLLSSFALAEAPSLLATSKFPVVFPLPQTHCGRWLSANFTRSSTREARAKAIVARFLKHEIRPRPIKGAPVIIDHQRIKDLFFEHDVYPHDLVVTWFAGVLGTYPGTDVKAATAIYLNELREHANRNRQFPLLLGLPATSPDPDYLRIAIWGSQFQLSAQATRTLFEKTTTLFYRHRYSLGAESYRPGAPMGQTPRSVVNVWSLADRTGLAIENLAEFFAAVEYLHGAKAFAFGPEFLADLFKQGLARGLTLGQTYEVLVTAHDRLVDRAGFGVLRSMLFREKLPYPIHLIFPFYELAIEYHADPKKLFVDIDTLANVLGEDCAETTIVHLFYMQNRLGLKPEELKRVYTDVSVVLKSDRERLQALRYHYLERKSLPDAIERARREEQELKAQEARIAALVRP